MCRIHTVISRFSIKQKDHFSQQALTNQLIRYSCFKIFVGKSTSKSKYLYVFINQRYLSCIPRKHKSFWSLSRLANFAVSQNANFLFMKNLPTSFLGSFYVVLGKRVSREKKGNLKNDVLQLLKLGGERLE